MTDKNHEILDMQSAKAWLLSNVSKSNKANLFIDSKSIGDPLVTLLLDTDEPLIHKFSSIVINGSVPETYADIFNDKNLTNLSFIKKTIGSPIKISVSIGRKAYLYLDTQNHIRSSSDDQEIGRILESIHSSFDSLTGK